MTIALGSVRVSSKKHFFVAASSRWMIRQVLRQRSRFDSTRSTAPTTTPKRLGDKATPEEVQQYLRQANATMEQYHHTRRLAAQGKLPNRNAHYYKGSNGGSLFGENSTHNVQMAMLGIFLLAFSATPYVGQRIAQDAEFRNKYIPSWYDYTVRAPEHAWTRQELHEQRIQVEQELRERAARGEFAPHHLQQLHLQFRGSDVPEGYQSEWDRIHPGLDDDESVNED